MNPTYHAFPGLKFQTPVNTPYDATLIKILDFNGFELSDLKKKNRQREVVDTRMLCVGVLKYEQRWTLKRIGQFFNQDHTTVIHSLSKLKSLTQTDENIRHQVSMFCPQLLVKEKLY